MPSQTLNDHHILATCDGVYTAAVAVLGIEFHGFIEVLVTLRKSLLSAQPSIALKPRTPPGSGLVVPVGEFV